MIPETPVVNQIPFPQPSENPSKRSSITLALCPPSDLTFRSEDQSAPPGLTFVPIHILRALVPAIIAEYGAHVPPVIGQAFVSGPALLDSAYAGFDP
jgi:hypothetical protein